MAEFAKKLRVKAPDGTTQAITIYSTIGECGSPHIEYCKVDGVPGYMAGDPNGNSRVAYKEHNGTTGKLMLTGKPPYGKSEYRNPGTYTFTVPRGINKLKVEVAGAGGGGGTGYCYYSSREDGTAWDDKYKGGNGGRGAKVNTTLAVTNGQTVKVVVGSGGSGGAGSTKGSGYGTEGGKGGTSIVHNINAEGGNGGRPADGVRDKDGANGSNAGNGQGASGGAGPYGTPNNRRPTGARGANGWVIIEYGGDI